jgi:hypothetical protein
MATLTNTQISVTYVGLLKTSANTVLTSTAQQITDGDGNNSIMFLSTAGVGIGGSPASGKELDVTGNVQVTGDLIVDNITIDGSTITNASGDLTIVNTNDDGDILLQTDNGSGGTTTYLQLDGGSVIVQLKKDLYALDNVKLRAGNAGDLQIFHDSSNSTIQNDTGDLTIVNTADDKDIIFQSDDASGGVTTYFKLDGSAGFTVASKKFRFEDNVNLTLGTGDDLVIRHDASNSHIENATGTLNIEANNLRLGNFGTDNFIIATNAGSVELYHNDVKKLETTSTGAKVQSTGTATLTLLDADDSSEISINHNANVTTIVYNDLIFDAGGGNNVLQLDGTSAIKALENITLPDSKKIILGTGGDLEIYHDGSNSYVDQQGTGNLNIRNTTDDKDITLQSDDGSGGVTTYVQLDGSLGITTFHKNLYLLDSVEIRVGTGSDLKIYHDGSNSYIDEVGTGSLFIRGSDIFIKANATEDAIIARANAEVELYHNGSEKFATTSTGVTVSGTITANSDSDQILNLNSSDSNAVYLAYQRGGTRKAYIGYGGSGNTFNIVNEISDGDISIVGNDGGVTTPVLSFDVSDSGAATFSGNITAKSSGSNADEISLTHSGNTVKIASLGQNSGHGSLTLRNNSGVVTVSASSDGTDSTISNGTGDLTIQNTADDKDIIFRSDDGSGGNAEYFRLDGSITENTFSKTTKVIDNFFIGAGSSTDLYLTHDGSNSSIINTTGNLTIQNNTDDGDIIFRSDDGSGGTTEYLRLDGSQTIIDVATRTLFRDSVKATFGAGYDLVIYHDGSNSYVQQQGTGDLIIRNSADDKDIIFQSDDGSGGTTEYFRLNGDNSDVIFSKPIELEDSVELRIGGSGADLRFFHSTNSFMQNFVGDLQIEQHTNDKDIFLRCDDGSGGVTTYILLDGSEVATKIETVKIFMPNLPTSDPSVAGQLYNDSGTLKISAG